MARVGKGGTVMTQTRTIVVICIAVIMTILAMQNITPVQMQFLLWQFSLPLVLVIGLFLVLGFIVGYGFKTIIMFRKSGDRDEEPGDEEVR